MKMKIIYNGKRLVDGKDCGYDIDTEYAQAGLTLCQCAEFGFIVAEISHAKRNPGIWHDFSRTDPDIRIKIRAEEVLPPGVRTKSEAIADLTERLGIARDGCKRARKFVLAMETKHQECYPLLMYMLDTAIAIADVEKTDG